MNKGLKTVFCVLCILLCVIPSLGMIFHPTTEPIGNERSADPPEFIRDGSLNVDFFPQLGEYFEKHFAFRPEIITADAQIQSNVFRTSNVDTVAVGKDGWLYYTSSIDDYLGRDPLSSREIAGVVHNLELLESFSQSRGAEFIFTVAPNKNTLYPDQMPYYYGAQVSQTYNRDQLKAALAGSELTYVDLFDPLGGQDEVLYFKRDSHWNNKGALLAYDTILTAAGKAHDDYASADVQRRKDFTGDLSRMIYPASKDAEYNYYYGAEDRYQYVTETESVEDPMIKTRCDGATGNLYMYRDSFGNALVPFFAAAYGEATFSKAFTTDMTAVFEQNRPDTFLMELVERNIDWLITQPPLIPAPELSFYKTDDARAIEASPELSVKVSDYSPSYIEIKGSVDAVSLPDDTVFYLALSSGGKQIGTYEAYAAADVDGRAGFAAYIPIASVGEDVATMDVTVIAEDGGFYSLGTVTGAVVEQPSF